jgi:protein-disulfide isomerase
MSIFSNLKKTHKPKADVETGATQSDVGGIERLNIITNIQGTYVERRLKASGVASVYLSENPKSQAILLSTLSFPGVNYSLRFLPENKLTGDLCHFLLSSAFDEQGKIVDDTAIVYPIVDDLAQGSQPLLEKLLALPLYQEISSMMKEAALGLGDEGQAGRARSNKSGQGYSVNRSGSAAWLNAAKTVLKMAAALAVVCVFVLIGLVWYGDKYLPKDAKGQLVAPVATAATAPSATNANAVNTNNGVSSTQTETGGGLLAPDERRALAAVVAKTGIELSSTGQPFVVFADMGCLACQQFEASLLKHIAQDKTLAPVIVPVAFKGLPEQLAKILCHKNPAAAWAMSIQEVDKLPVCSEGLKQVEVNNALFVALRLDRTPTIVTSNGRIAVGAKDFDGLMSWIAKN